MTPRIARSVAFCLTPTLFLMNACQGPASADVLFVNAAVWTGVPGAPPASVVAVGDGRILAVGTEEDVASYRADKTTVIDLQGRSLLPGFIDSHVHFTDGGFKLSGVQLRDAASREEFILRIGNFAATHPGDVWITGGDWDHEAWGGELPHRDLIDPVTRGHAVFVNRLDGHMALANSIVLERAGITNDTPDPPGGEIVRDPDGRATGVLKDEAMNLVFDVMPGPSEEEMDRAVQAAIRHALSLGVTQVHDMGTWEHLEAYRRAQAQGRLPMRIYSVVPMDSWERLRDYMDEHGPGDDRLWWGGLKAFVDGSLGSTTAWFYEPYTDDPSTTGLLTNDTTELRRWILDADQAGLHTIVHAIGDRANDWLLDVFEEAGRAHVRSDRRPRIEHAQHLSSAAIPRFAELGVIASAQPYHAADDGRWAERRIGPDRLKTTYAFRSLLDAGAELALGSDWTVAPMNPLAGLDAAITRRTLDGANPEGWVPEERIQLEEALVGYTSAAARAGYSDDRVGRIVTGLRADLVVLSDDIFEVDPLLVGTLQVDLTMVDGEIVFERSGS